MQADTYIPRRLDDRWKVGFWDLDVAAPVIFGLFLVEFSYAGGRMHLKTFCTMYDLVDGTLDPSTFSASADVWALLATPNPARFATADSILQKIERIAKRISATGH